MVAAEEVPLRLRRGAGLGGASWEPMMRPSCCSYSRLSSSSRLRWTQETGQVAKRESCS